MSLYGILRFCALFTMTSAILGSHHSGSPDFFEHDTAKMGKLIEKGDISAGRPIYSQSANATRLVPGAELLSINGHPPLIKVGKHDYYINGTMPKVVKFLRAMGSYGSIKGQYLRQDGHWEDINEDGRTGSNEEGQGLYLVVEKWDKKRFGQAVPNAADIMAKEFLDGIKKIATASVLDLPSILEPVFGPEATEILQFAMDRVGDLLEDKKKADSPAVFLDDDGVKDMITEALKGTEFAEKHSDMIEMLFGNPDSKGGLGNLVLALYERRYMDLVLGFGDRAASKIAEALGGLEAFNNKRDEDKRTMEDVFGNNEIANRVGDFLSSQGFSSLAELTLQPGVGGGNIVMSLWDEMKSELLQQHPKWIMRITAYPPPPTKARLIHSLAHELTPVELADEIEALLD